MDKNRKITENNGLSPVQEKLIEALLQYPTIKAAAESVEITDRTARNYMQEPAFASAYTQAKQEMAGAIRGSLVALANKAIEGLDSLLDSEKEMAKLGAVKLILDRLAPELSVQPSQEEAIPRDLLQYLTDDEIALLERITNDATARREAKMQSGETNG